MLRKLAGRIESSPRVPAWLRAKPDFLVIGAQKAGTTSLHHYLAQHPRLHAARVKEVHYFDLAFDRGPDWYALHFPTLAGTAARRLRAGGGILHFESTPYYLYHPLVPGRVKEALPRARFVVLLRDPVKRAVSQYFHSLRNGHETRPIREAFSGESDILREAEAAFASDPHYRGKDFQNRTYCARGYYARQLERWFALFPRDRFLILRSEDFFADPLPHLDLVCQWLGIDPFTQAVPHPALEPRNIGPVESADPRLVQELRAHFRPYNAALTELLGRDFGW